MTEQAVADRPTSTPDLDLDDIESVEPATASDPGAPWGRRVDGTPRARPGRKPGQRTGTGRRTTATGRTAKITAPKPVGARKPPASAKKTDYATPLNGVLQIIAAPLTMIGTRRPVFLADSVTITTYGPGVSEALSDLANERPEVAAVLERVLSVGPYGALLASVFPLVLQLAANHKVVPAGIFGTLEPDHLVAAAQAQMERQAA